MTSRRALSSLLLALLLGLGLGHGPASANGNNGQSAPVSSPNGSEAKPAPASPTLSDLGRSLRNYFTEDELALLFEYMKDSVIAAFKGEEVFLPPDLAFKLEILVARMKKEGGHYMDNLVRQLEKDLERNLKEKLKEKLAPPDTSRTPYMPPEPPVTVPNFFPPYVTVPVYPAYPVFPSPYPPPQPSDP